MNWRDRAAEFYTRLNGRARPYRAYRCGQCRHRKNLNRELWQYVRPPRCACCGARDWRLDMSRFWEWRDRQGVFQTCHCDGAHYPHRQGAVRLCKWAPWYLDEEPMPF